MLLTCNPMVLAASTRIIDQDIELRDSLVEYYQEFSRRVGGKKLGQ